MLACPRLPRQHVPWLLSPRICLRGMPRGKCSIFPSLSAQRNTRMKRDQQERRCERSFIFFFLISSPVFRFCCSGSPGRVAHRRCKTSIPLSFAPRNDSRCRIDLINQHQAESSRMNRAGQPTSQPASQQASLPHPDAIKPVAASLVAPLHRHVYVHVGVWLLVRTGITLKLFRHEMPRDRSLSSAGFSRSGYAEPI